jgi:hypothetical protein
MTFAGECYHLAMGNWLRPRPQFAWRMNVLFWLVVAANAVAYAILRRTSGTVNQSDAAIVTTELAMSAMGLCLQIVTRPTA